MRENYYALLFDQFVSAIVDLRGKYLARFLVNRTKYGPEDYALEVKAFCIFSHAALEFLFESWAIAYGDHVVKRWKSTGTASPAMISLCLYHGKVGPKLYETSAKLPKYPDVLSNSIENALQTLQDYIQGQNNGIGMRHLRQMFWPLNIDVGSDPLRFEGSLARLSKVRGAYAHTYVKSDHIAPEDANKVVSDCVDLAAEVESVLTFETFGVLDLGKRPLIDCLSRVLEKKWQAAKVAAKPKKRSAVASRKAKPLSSNVRKGKKARK